MKVYTIGDFVFEIWLESIHQKRCEIVAAAGRVSILYFEEASGLEFPEFFVEAMGFLDEFFVRTCLMELSLADHDNAIHLHDGG